MARARGPSEATRTPEFVGRRQTDHPPAPARSPKGASQRERESGATAEGKRGGGGGEDRTSNQLVFFRASVSCYSGAAFD